MALPQPPLPAARATTARRGTIRHRRLLVAVVVSLAMSVAPAGSPAAAACGSLQSLVDLAGPGSTITAPACVYHEAVSIHKALTINATGAVVDGDHVRTIGVAVLADDVTINGLTVRNVVPGSHGGAVWSSGVSRFTFRDGAALDSATICISLNGGTGHRVLDSELSGCGKEGYFMNGVSDTLFRGNRIHDNNTALAFDPEVEAGGGKTMASQRVTFDGNEVAHNGGPGIWFDNGVVGATAINNRVHDNDRAGIFFEISNGARISGNAVWNNGFGFVAWGYGAGITISSSDRADVHDNTLAWNARGISVISQARELQPHNGDVVHGNVIVQAAGAFVTGFYDDHGGTLFDASNGNEGYGNRYWVGVGEPSTDRFGWSGPKSRLSDYNATPGEEAGSYLTTPDRDAALASAGIPILDGSPPAPGAGPTPTPTPTPTPSPTPAATPVPGGTPAPPPAPGPTPPGSTTPVAGSPSLSFRTGQMRADAALPGRLSWPVTPGAGAYQVQVSRDGGTWRSLAPATTGSRAVGFMLESGSRYRARLRVKSLAGVWGSWRFGDTIGTTRLQETAAAIQYGGSWPRAVSAGASGRYVRFA